GNAASLDALVFLARQQPLAPTSVSGGDISFSLDLGVAPAQESLAPSLSSSGDSSLSLGPSSAASQTDANMPLLEIAHALEKHPDARPYHRLLALQLRVGHDPALTDQYVAQAVERFGKGDDETLAVLAEWLNSIGRARKTLELLPRDRAVQRQDLFLRHIDALAALERWDEVKETLTGEGFPLDPVFQHMYLATARSRLGEATAATN